MTAVRFHLLGERPYERAFEMMGHEARDLSAPFEQIADELLHSVSEQFRTEGTRTGARWHSLSAAYAKWKQERWPGRPILVASGKMRAAAFDRGRAVNISPQRLVYEIDDPKAIYHQRGDGHMPQRRLVDIGAADRRAFDRVFVRWLNDLRRGPLARSIP